MNLNCVGVINIVIVYEKLRCSKWINGLFVVFNDVSGLDVLGKNVKDFYLFFVVF